MTNLESSRWFYQKNTESKIESVSGYGSFLRSTTAIRNFLPNIIQKYSITSIVDCPCGDWNWMQHVDLSMVDYLGLDILPEIIEQNNEKFSKNNIKFDVFDILYQIPPACDLLICRDLLFHMSLSNMELAAQNLQRCKSKFILTTTFPNVKKNCELTIPELNANWGYRDINVELSPIDFKNCIDEINEGKHCHNRSMRLYEMQ